MADDPCQFDLDWNGYWGDLPSEVACGEPSMATISFACVHEHLDKPRTCPACASDVQQASGQLTCPHCWNGPEQHKCMCLVVIEWDSGEKTIVQEVAHV